MVDRSERIVGCLLGGAVGDALGAPVEFSSLAEIRSSFGEGGVRRYAPAYGGLGRITDDTQMTLFTAEGLLRAPTTDDATRVIAIHRAYLRWLHTQAFRSAHPELEDALSGWLLHEPALHDRRAPGNTCIGGLCEARRGSPEAPLNDSKGCGGVMRVAPIGLCCEEPWELAVRACALTHGHPSGYLAGGAFAQILAELVRGRGLREAIETARARLTGEDARECAEAIDAAVAAADVGPRSAQTVESLGGGWVAEEALAIAIYCALTAGDTTSGPNAFTDALSLAVTHSGDSDSTGELAGQLLGALGGPAIIDPLLLRPLELRDVVEQIAHDLADLADGKPAAPDRYPRDG